MKKYHKVDVTETKLEDIIRQTPGYIGPGLKYVTRQHPTARGPLDLLLVDSGGALVIAELKVLRDDNMLTQAIDYYDDIVENIEGLARIYQDSNIDPTKAPRLILLAPNFSQELINRCKWIDIPLLLIEYQCIALVNNPEVPILVTKEIEIPERKKSLISAQTKSI